MMRAQPQAAVLVASAADFTAAAYGAWTAGLGVMPLPADHPDARLAHMLGDCRPHVLLTCASLAPRARSLAAETAVPVLVLDDIAAAPTPAPAPPAPPPADAPAFTVFTSGSTGRPKGVQIRSDQISPLIAWEERAWDLGPWVRMAQTLSLGFDFGLQEVFSALSVGGCLVVPGRGDRRSAQDYARFLRRERISVLFTTPSHAVELAATGEPLPDLRLVQLAGELLRRTTVTGIRALVGPECRIYNGYGPTETSVNCLVYEIPRSVPDHELPDVLPVGTPTGAARIHLVDARNRRVPVGATGEILIGGPGVAEGYLNRPELTAERFVTLEHLDPGPLYRTGDLAHLRRDGNFVVVGRADRQVKVRGYRVEPGEVEHVLGGAPGVASATVRVLGDPGELTAFLVGDRIDPEAVSRHAKGFLTPAMLPTAVVLLDRLPVTLNGKLDENALREIALRHGTRVLPATASPAELETAVREIWASALELDDVDPAANVFDLGAHSLIVTRVHRRLQVAAGVTFPVQDIFEYPCPGDLARHVTAQRHAEDES